MKKTILFIVLATLCLNFRARAQSTIHITGRVIDSVDNTPLHGATVKIKSTAISTSTNENGEFTLNTTASSGILIISYIGYQTINIEFNESSKNPLQIHLSEDSGTLKEVSIVSTGYQTLHKERATGSFVQLDSAIINRRVSTDILTRLEGITPGLLFNHNTINSINGSLDLSIRGHSTLFANDQPLVVVDGFPYDGDINNINPNDIESVTVLKDAAAASIWGVRSGNGVIVLTTKKGKLNQPLSVDFNANVTIGNKPNAFYSPNFLDANDFINIEENLFNSGYYNSKLSSRQHLPVSPVVQILANEKAGQLTAGQANAQIDAIRDLDVRNDIEKYLYQNGVDQQYNLNLKGGSSKATYFFSAGYDNDLSNITGNKNDRLTLNSQNTFKPVKDLELLVGINYTKSKSADNGIQSLSTGGGYGSIYPYAQLADANGNPLAVVKDYNYSWITNPTAQSGLLNWQYKPLDELKNADNLSESNDVRINTGLKYSFIQGFNAEIKYQYETSNTNGNNYYSPATYYARNIINEFTSQSGGTITNVVPVGGILQQSESDLSSQHLRGQVNFQHNWDKKHDLTLLAGSEINQTITSSNANTVYGYNNDLGTLQNVDFADSFPLYPSGHGKIPTTLGFNKYTDRYVSYFSNGTYTFDDKYTASLSGRIDKSNLFGVNTNQKSVPLYSAGLSWNLSKENFYKVSWLPYLKLRATYGYNGNIDKNVAAVTTISYSNYNYYSPDPYAYVVNPGNPELRWEKDRMINLAADFASKNQIIGGSIDYFFKKGIDLFGDSPLSPSTGFTVFRGNTAETNGNGMDLVLNSKNISTAHFKWLTNFQLSYVLDKVSKYDLPQTSSDALSIGAGNSGTILPIIGRPIFAIYSYKWEGLTHTTGDPQGYLNGKITTDYADIIANTKLSDLVYNGPSRPTTFGSFRNTFSYNNLSLSFNVIYKLNYYFRRSSVEYGALFSGWYMNSDYTKRWQKPGDELTTNVPSIQYPPVDNNRDLFYQNSSVLVDNGDNIRLQDISLSYDFLKKDWRKLPFSHLQIYCYVNNVGILWRANHDHLDPDLYSSSNAYPAPRTIAFGIKTNF